GSELRSRYGMMGAVSDVLIRRIPDRISETAPGRTPIARARPPLVLPGFSSPRSIIETSSMATSFPNFVKNSNSDYQKSSLTLTSEYRKFMDLAFDSIGAPGKGQSMQSSSWVPEHSTAL